MVRKQCIQIRCFIFPVNLDSEIILSEILGHLVIRVKRVGTVSYTHLEENYYLDLAIKQGFFNDRLQISFSVSDVFDTSEWQARLNTGSYRLANYSKEATHAYWIGLTFNFNNFKSRPSADDSHPQKRQVIQLGQ